ncbi:LysR family transcriptional regulator [Microvirga sp. VF16]|uniref:LysR family transcriptional regulator n=1 Tax=Microvirga sp. VF16 TaxID=2807101 RepID=UPI00193D61E5|nr:LysR family transcriptional regulator [Microvirga sp. VF16]QRM34298.1 LysR family transcriptional regulator [Microvirga sp. VF16]
MNKMNLARIDLNLLVVFNEVWDCGSVTDAAGRLGLSQPAVSHALGRLRALLDDPLFIRSGGRLAPTARAVALASPLREALGAVERALKEPTFAPAETKRRFTIGASEFTSLTLLPMLCPELSAQAPGASFTFQGIDESVYDLLADGRLDVAFWATDPPGDPFSSAELFRETHVVVVGSHHPLAQGNHRRSLSLEGYLAYPHLKVNFTTTIPNLIDTALSAIGQSRSVALETAHLAATAAILRATPFVMTIPSRVLNAIGSEGLTTYPVPFDVPDFVYRVLWHRWADREPGSIWLRDQIVRSAMALTD